MSTLLLNQLVRPNFSEEEASAAENAGVDQPYTWQQQLEAIRARLIVNRMNAEPAAPSSRPIR